MRNIQSLLCVFFGLIFFTQTLNAQLLVKGKVVNLERQGVPYANITIDNFGSCSNEAGFFELKTVGINTSLPVKISCIGYETKVISLKQTSGEIDLGEISLVTKVTELSEVVVRAKMTTVEETLKKIEENLSENYSSESFIREIFVLVKKYNSSNELLQKSQAFLNEYCRKGYTKNWKRADDLIQSTVNGEGQFSAVDDQEFYWIDLFFLRRHDAYRYSHPYTTPKAYRYSIDKDIYQYDGYSAIAINYSLLNPATAKDGGWPNATEISGRIYVNESDHAILRIEETIVLKDYDPNDKSNQEVKFNTAIQFKKLTNIVNFKKVGRYYFLADSHVERINADIRKPWLVAKSHLVVTAYKKYSSDCNPCNIEFSKAKSDSDFWKTSTVFLD